MGGEFCWGLLGQPRVLGAVSAVVMLSANNPPRAVEAMRTLAGKRTIPLLIGHGTRDKVFGWDGAKALYASLHAEGYPVRFVSFETGNHGTPLRMLDWRDSLNWLLTRP
jgi:predicted esterase